MLPPDALELIANRFKALSEVLRLRLLMVLEKEERSVSELVEATGASQANVSRQLAALARAGVVGRRKEGVNVFYRVVDPAIFQLCDHVCGSLQRQVARQAESVRLLGPG
jgi:ArsR family transcriptional regulator